MTNYILKAETLHVNLSPVAFRHVSKDFFKCYLDFQPPKQFSIVPYFLCCRAIELGLKATHLESKRQSEVKSLYSHDLVESYNDLPASEKKLSQVEFELLDTANAIYWDKHFEYLNVVDAATGFNRFPNLSALAQLARKIIKYDV